jgi:threonine dehydrogenase-like Zn-dependent dehydrogenase
MSKLQSSSKNMVKNGAKLVIIGIHHIPGEIDLQQITMNSQLIIGSANYEDVDYVLNFMETTPYNLAHLVTHEFSLEEFDTAITAAGKSNEGLKVVIKH